MEKKCEKPSVGIWWFYFEEVIFSDAVKVEGGTHYGDCITGISDHAVFWEKLEAAGELKKLPPLLRLEYFYIPRGRVVFHNDTGRFTILHGGLNKSELKKIRQFFCLPKELTDYDTDLHYEIKIFVNTYLIHN